MPQPLNALILEDSPSDVILLLRELRRGGFEVHHVQVDNADDLNTALHNGDWDIILSDYSMPSFDAPTALQIVREQGYDLPFIIISGTVGEDAAVAAMKAGASDFFAKGKLTRLVPTVERELHEARSRRQRREAEARFTTAFHASPVGISISRLSDGQVIDVNAQYLQIFGHAREDLVGQSGLELESWGTAEQRDNFFQRLRETGTVRNVEVEIQRGQGKQGYALLSAEMIQLDNEPCILTMVYDISDRKYAEEALRSSEQKFRLLAENSTDMISRQTPDGTYLYVSPASLTLLGYEPDELIGHSAYQLCHPADLASITTAYNAILELPNVYTFTVTYRNCRKDGNYVWLETISRAIRDPETSEVLEIQSALRDISQRKEAEAAVERYTERLTLLHEIDRAILVADKPQTIAESVLTRLQKLMGFDSASITAFNLDRQQFAVLAALAPIMGYDSREDLAVLERLKQNEVDYTSDLLTATQRSSGDKLLLAAGIRSNLRIPLTAGGKLLGSFNLRSSKPNAFSSQDLDIAREVSAQLAISIENARLFQVEQRRNRELTALHQASLQLTSSLDVETVLNTILDYAILLVHANSAHIFLYDGKELAFGAGQGQNESGTAPTAALHPDALTYSVARSGERLIISDANQYSAPQDWQWGGALVGLPLHIGDVINGVMSLTYQEPHQFDEQEIHLLELLADQAAIAIHNAQLYEQIHRHAEELEQRVAERTAALQASEAKYRALIEFAPDPIVIFDANGAITLANKRAEESFGYRQHELIGNSVEILLPGRLEDLNYALDSSAASPVHHVIGATLELTARHRNGKEIPVKVGLSPINLDTETLVMAYVVDVTADKQLEEGLRTALAKERELNDLKTSFTSIVSHEFRTPLSVILSSTDLLTKYADRMDENRRREKLDNITRQVKRLVQLLDDVLTITRSDTLGFKFKPRKIDVVALCEEIIEELRVGYGSEIPIDFTSQGDCGWSGVDEFLFSHILQNLASNAIKYSRAGGKVIITLTCLESELTLRVEDQGIGIPRQYRKRLFEAFHRANNVGQIQGTGIGLTIVKRAVDAHGGSIDFESEEGKGTTFIVKLPSIPNAPATDESFTS